jgi:hypothetical protein
MKYKELSNLFSQATNWFESEGLSIQRSRISHYKSELEKLSKWAEEESIEKNIETTKVHYWRSILYEALEIVEIYRSLNCNESQDITRRLKQIAKGPVLLADELVASASNAPRNYQFELLVASRFMNAGLNIFLDEKNDLVIRLANGIIPIECKRPQSFTQANKNIRKGCAQIKRSFNDLPIGSRFPGILVFGIEKLNNQYKKILVSSSVEKAKQALDKTCTDFFRRHIKRVQEKGKTHVGGFIVTLNTMSEIDGYLNYGTFLTTSYWANQQVADHINIHLRNIS